MDCGWSPSPLVTAGGVAEQLQYRNDLTARQTRILNSDLVLLLGAIVTAAEPTPPDLVAEDSLLFFALHFWILWVRNSDKTEMAFLHLWISSLSWDDLKTGWG